MSWVSDSTKNNQYGFQAHSRDRDQSVTLDVKPTGNSNPTNPNDYTFDDKQKGMAYQDILNKMQTMDIKQPSYKQADAEFEKNINTPMMNKYKGGSSSNKQRMAGDYLSGFTSQFRDNTDNLSDFISQFSDNTDYMGTGQEDYKDGVSNTPTQSSEGKPFNAPPPMNSGPSENSSGAIMGGSGDVMNKKPVQNPPSPNSGSSEKGKLIGDLIPKGSEQYEKLSPEDKWAVDKKRPAEGYGEITAMNRDGSDGRTGTPTAGYVKWMKDKGAPDQQKAQRAQEYSKNQGIIDNYTKVKNDSNVDGETSEDRQNQRRANIQSDMAYSSAVEANRNADNNRSSVEANAQKMYDRLKAAERQDRRYF